MTAATSITIARQFNGPPDSGNGGYVAGQVASFLPDAKGDLWPEVTLRLPPPLDTPMEVAVDGETVRLLKDGALYAEGVLKHTELSVPPPPGPHGAEDARSRFSGFRFHPLSTCFVCGTDRTDGDGLQIYTGPVGDGAAASGTMVAAPWVPHAHFADGEGFIRPEILWGALDCPGAFAVEQGTESSLKLLGRLAVRILARPKAGEHCVVTGWYLGSEGRKHYAGTAVFDDQAQVLAMGRATWVELKTG